MLVARIVSGPPAVRQRREDRLFQRQVLESRLDNDVSLVGDPLEGVGVAQALDHLVALVSRNALPRHEALQAVRDATAPALDCGFIDIEKHYLVAGLQADLRDAGAHRSGADYANDQAAAPLTRP